MFPDAVSFETLPVPVIACELDGTVVAQNPAAHRLAGRDVVGAKLDTVIPGILDRWPACLAGARGRPDDATVDTPTGRVVVTIGAGDGRELALVYVLDADRKDDRLDSLGLVAGGIAHDFNNLLVGVLAEASAAREDDSLAVPTREALRRIEAAARRMAQLTRQLLAYSGRAQFTTVAVAVDELLGDLREQLVRLVRPDLALTLAPAAPSAVVEADPALLRQVVVNLAANASDAAAARVEIASCVVSRDGLPFWLLEVVDDGPGIDAATVARMFDPFFTTKPGRHGLGLSAVHGIVRRLGGDIDVDTRPGHGSRFRVHLPVAIGAEPVRRPPTEGILPIPKLTGVRALVVDDEPSVRATVRRLLERRGAIVVVASDGREAETRLRTETFQLVVSDISMPGCSGYDVLVAARAMHPELPVVLMSGYTEKMRGEGVEEEPDAFLEKPFTAKTLDAIVDEVLKRKR